MRRNLFHGLERRLWPALLLFVLLVPGLAVTPDESSGACTPEGALLVALVPAPDEPGESVTTSLLAGAVGAACLPRQVASQAELWAPSAAREADRLSGEAHGSFAAPPPRRP